MPTMQLFNDHFSYAEQAAAEIAANGLEASDFGATRGEWIGRTPHSHDIGADIYILEGTFNIRDDGDGATYAAGPGSKLVVPAETLHTELDSEFRALVGTHAKAAATAEA